LKKVDHNIAILEKRQFFRRKWGKIAENCDHNIDPWDKIVIFKKLPKVNNPPKGKKLARSGHHAHTCTDLA
jgi:hypothetical protein